MHTYQRTFPGLPEEIRHARHWARHVLGNHCHAEDAALIVTELGANAVLHTASGDSTGNFCVTLSPSHSALTVSVSDSGDAKTAPRVEHPTNDDLHGRGLGIVTALADRVEIDRDDQGGPHGHRASRPGRGRGGPDVLTRRLRALAYAFGDASKRPRRTAGGQADRHRPPPSRQGRTMTSDPGTAVSAEGAPWTIARIQNTLSAEVVIRRFLMDLAHAPEHRVMEVFAAWRSVAATIEANAAQQLTAERTGLPANPQDSPAASTDGEPAGDQDQSESRGISARRQPPAGRGPRRHRDTP